METTDISISSLDPAPWNSNKMDDLMLSRLQSNMQKYGILEHLVVRNQPGGRFQVVNGNQRLIALENLGYTHVSCFVVDLDDAHAKLLSQALNHIHGQDDLGLRAEVLRGVLASIDESEVLKILPETRESLQAFASLGKTDMAAHLKAWQTAQAARLKHLQVQLTPAQMEVVEEALRRIVPKARELHEKSPNIRGTAVYLLSKFYLDNCEVLQ